MYKLYHYPLCPFSRKVRIVLHEKNVRFSLTQEDFWKRRPNFLRLNPSGKVPMLGRLPNLLIQDSQAICEYLEEEYSQNILLPGSPAQRAEVRRIVSWFDEKFFSETSFYILNERVFNLFKKVPGPDTEILRMARSNLNYHIQYINYLLSSRRWLAGDKFSLADVTAFSHLSVLDYLNELSWTSQDEVKDWYAIVKSRPSVRAILSDIITGFTPPPHYSKLDF